MSTPAAASTVTDTTRFPVYASKTAYMADLNRIIHQNKGNHDLLMEMLHRLSNTDTDTWTADSEARGDA